MSLLMACQQSLASCSARSLPGRAAGHRMCNVHTRLRSPRVPATPRHGIQGRRVYVITAGIRAVESFDARVELEALPRQTLFQLLKSQAFCKQVSAGCSEKLGPDATVEFIDEVFQPVPWSLTTKRGVPTELEKYLDDEDYVVINVPPNFMFQAKISTPARLGAIFRRVAQ